MQNMKLSELKAKSPAELLVFAEEHEVENASTMRKQELMFAILKELAAQDVDITGVKVDGQDVDVVHKSDLIEERRVLKQAVQVVAVPA